MHINLLLRKRALAGFALMLLVASAGILTGCDLSRNYLKSDRAGNMEIQDYRDGLSERTPEVLADEDSASSQAANIPELKPYVSDASENLEPMPLVSISVNQTVPLRDVLFELAQQAEYDLELDPSIRGSIIFTAREKPFDLVIARISEIAGLRYRFADGILRVEVDAPFNKSYKVDYLSYIRSNTSSVRNNIAVVSGEGTDTGSDFQVTAESESNFWGELEQNLGQILGGATAPLRTSRDPRITVTEQNPDIAATAPVPTAEGGAPAGADGAAEQPQVNVTPPQAVLNVESLPVEDDAGTPAGAGTAGATFSVNRQAGIISAFATERQHKEIAEYLKIVRRSVTSQVLIEAKILEVALDDEHSAGIDWRVLNLFAGEGALSFMSDGASGSLNLLSEASIDDPISGELSAPGSFVVGFGGNDVQALIRAISRFGAVRALASPRLTVLNNQSAVLNVASNRVFFEIDIDVTTDEGVTQTDIDSDIRNVPEGVLVNVLPSINLDNNTISMAVRPTITRILRSVPDPAIQFVTASAIPPIEGVESLIPEVNVQEIDSVIQVRSGQPIVMGGLLQDRTATSEGGVPVLNEIPVAGNLFKNHSDLIRKTELVIFLKATIVEAPEDTIHDTDKDLYRMFSGDRRPLRL
jgi:MSHA biogenesis protein MshL